jgi:flavin reductase (DIM6/NTAB) family NADH-FMN oxidoreductase RutF
MAINLVGESQAHYLKHFGRGFDLGQPAFEGIATTRGVTGLPILSEALGYLEGPVVGSVDAGDHIVYLVRIEGAGSSPKLTEEKPMVHIRKNGFHY